MSRRFREPVDECDIPRDMILMAAANRLAMTPMYSQSMVDDSGELVYTDLVDQRINLWMQAQVNGVLEYQLLEDGGAVYTTQLVIAGERVYGAFKKLGPGTTCRPVGFGNLY